MKIPETATIILSRPDRLGDVVITSSCIAAVREKFPSARIYFLAKKEFQPLFEHSENLTGFLSIPEDEEASSTLVKIFSQLKPDSIVHFHPHRECYRAACEADIPIRIGWEKFLWTRWLTHSLPDTRQEGKKHEARYNFDLLQYLSVPFPEILRPDIHPDEEAKNSLARKLPWDIEKTDFIALHPAAARKKLWPTDRFAQLALWISKELSLKVVSIGATAADPVMREFQHLTQDMEMLHLEGKLSLAELSWLLQRSKLLVTSDTGPSHIAAAMNTPQIAIFGRAQPAYSPTRWKALNDNVEVLESVITQRFWETNPQFWRRGFENISLQQVQEAVKKCVAVNRTIH